MKFADGEIGQYNSFSVGDFVRVKVKNEGSRGDKNPMWRYLGTIAHLDHQQMMLQGEGGAMLFIDTATIVGIEDA